MTTLLSSGIPPLSFFLSKVVDMNNLIAGLRAYSQLIQEQNAKIEIYQDPMLYVESVDYQEKIDNFLDLLENERNRTEKTADKGSINS